VSVYISTIDVILGRQSVGPWELVSQAHHVATIRDPETREEHVIGVVFAHHDASEAADALENRAAREVYATRAYADRMEARAARVVAALRGEEVEE
jgi:hypothetical protein